MSQCSAENATNALGPYRREMHHLSEGDVPLMLTRPILNNGDHSKYIKWDQQRLSDLSVQLSLFIASRRYPGKHNSIYGNLH